MVYKLYHIYVIGTHILAPIIKQILTLESEFYSNIIYNDSLSIMKILSTLNPMVSHYFKMYQQS